MDETEGIIESDRQSQVFFVCDVKMKDLSKSKSPKFGDCLADVLEKMKPQNTPLSAKLFDPWINCL